MFEKEIEFIYNYYLNKIEKLNPFVTFNQLASADLHPALLQYVSAEIDYLIFEDRQKLLKESLFDYSGDKINGHFNKISEEIKLTKKFSKDYISKLLLHATSFNVNYTIRPNWSLLQFIFETDEEKYVSEVKQILNYLYYYPYYKRILVNYFNKKHLYKISEEEMADVLNKIDKINFDNNIEEIVDESLTNIVDFINVGGVGNDKIAKNMIELFLADKNFDESDKILEGRLAGSSEEKFSKSEYREIILSTHKIDDQLTPLDSEESLVSLETEVEEKDSPNEENLDESTALENISTEAEMSKSKADTTDHILDLINNKEDELLDEIEPPEIDEEPRFEDSNVQEVYDMVVEEEEIEEAELEQDPSEGERLNISISDAEESYLEELDELEEESNTEVEVETASNSNFEVNDHDENSYVIDSSSVTFSPDHFGDDESAEQQESSRSTNNTIPDDMIKNANIEKEIAEKESTADKTIDFEESEKVAELIKEIESSVNEDEPPKTKTQKIDIDISKFLKNKKVTKIIENIFDYDMEEFMKTVEEISECGSEEEALLILDKVVHGSYLDDSSREIKNFKKIISDLF